MSISKEQVSRLQRIINIRTSYTARVEAAGFKFDGAEVSYNIQTCGIDIGFRLICVCGTKEYAELRIPTEVLAELYDSSDEVLLDIFDPCKIIIDRGEFDYAHLIEDGYTPDQANEILRKLNAYDAGELKSISNQEQQ